MTQTPTALGFVTRTHPALKRWAKFCCASGAGCPPRCVHRQSEAPALARSLSSHAKLQLSRETPTLARSLSSHV